MLEQPYNPGGLFIGHKAIANAGFVQQILGLIGITFHFLAQLPHIDPQILDVIGIFWPPPIPSQLNCSGTLACKRGSACISRPPTTGTVMLIDLKLDRD